MCALDSLRECIVFLLERENLEEMIEPYYHMVHRFRRNWSTKDFSLLLTG